MSGPAHRPSRGGIQLLQAAMMTQILLGLIRFFAPKVGVALPESIWHLHPLLGITIAVVVLLVLRPRHGTAADRRRRIARFAPLAPLALGLAIAFGVQLGPLLVPAHMVVGLTALGLVDNALKRLLAAAPPAHDLVLPTGPQI